MGKNDFTFKPHGSGIIGKLVTSQPHPAATIELKDGVITLHSREYLHSEPVSQVIVEGVKKGASLNITVELTERRLLTVTVDDHKAEVQLNWPSYRGETISYTAGRRKATVELVEEPAAD